MVGSKNKIELVTGLDIGSTAIRIAVGQLTYGPHGQDFQIIGAVEVPSEGVNKGVVSSIEECVSSVSNALEQVEHLVGVPIEHAWIGISGTHIDSQESRGVVAAAKSNGEISEEDVERAVEAARTVATPLNYEILHVLPRSFTVDGQTGIKDPIGMTGIRLEVETQIIQGVAQHIKNLTKAVYRTGIDIDDLVLSILAVGDAVVTSRQKELGVAVVNIGGSTTSLVIYEEGDIIHTAVLPIGSEHVTNDLAIGLRSSIDVAERVKIEYGNCMVKGLSRKEKIDLSTVGSEVEEQVELKYIAEIVAARMEEILEKVNDELSKVGRAGLLPAGVVFTGGGAKISGLIELTKESMGLPASLGYPMDLISVTEKVNDLSFSTAIGLVNWGVSMSGVGGRKPRRLKSVDKVSGQVKNWFKSLIP